jgi:hypothetical protein
MDVCMTAPLQSLCLLPQNAPSLKRALSIGLDADVMWICD